MSESKSRYQLSALLKVNLWVTGFAAIGLILESQLGLNGGPFKPILSALMILSGSAASTEFLWRKAGGWRICLFVLSIGAASEVFGLYFGLPFGQYAYTHEWQPTLLLPGDVQFPLLLPFAWLLIVASAWSIASIFRKFKVFITALIAMLIDLPMESVMTKSLQYWQWSEQGPLFGAPILNSFGWLLTAGLAAAIISKSARAEPEPQIGMTVLTAFTGFLCLVAFAAPTGDASGITLGVIFGVLVTMWSVRGKTRSSGERPGDVIRLGVVGAGMGGLAAALRLSHLGYEVTVFEKNEFVGGRNHALQVGESSFDAGPTLLMMLEPLKRLFDDIGEDIDTQCPIELVDPGYRAFFADGLRLDATPNTAKMIEQIRRISTEKDAHSFARLVGDLSLLYCESTDRFIRNPYQSRLSLLKPSLLATAVRLGVFGSLWKNVDNRFEDPRLKMLFSFQSMYLGLSPFEAPWVYGSLCYMEYGEGIWYPKGGINAIAEKLKELAVNRGCRFQFGEAVTNVTGKSIRLESGETNVFDQVITNADLPYAAKVLVGSPVKRNLEPSCGALMFYWDSTDPADQLLHHNVFFGGDYQGNFESIFKHRTHPEDPSFYVCVSSKTDQQRSSAFGSNIMVLVPCPVDQEWSKETINVYREKVIQRLEHEIGFKSESIQAEHIRTPDEWSTLFNLDRGSAFGISHKLTQSAFMRPSLKSSHDPNLFYVGASTNPGNGIPMVLISAEMVTDLVVGGTE
jgi:phytoene desaturase